MSSNFVKMECKTHVLYYPIKNCYISFLLKNSIHYATPNNISLNSQLGWVFKWVLKLIGCSYIYFLIFDIMKWHIRIEICKT